MPRVAACFAGWRCKAAGVHRTHPFTIELAAAHKTACRAHRHRADTSAVMHARAGGAPHWRAIKLCSLQRPAQHMHIQAAWPITKHPCVRHSLLQLTARAGNFAATRFRSFVVFSAAVRSTASRVDTRRSAPRSCNVLGPVVIPRTSVHGMTRMPRGVAHAGRRKPQRRTPEAARRRIREPTARRQHADEVAQGRALPGRLHAWQSVGQGRLCHSAPWYAPKPTCW